jgi:large subunit ribosomal protein L13
VDTLSYKTVSVGAANVKKEWYVIDAENQIVGRLASQVAKIIRGKNKPYFTPNIDCGDNVIIINADKVRFTGKKNDQKQYVRYTGYPGGQRFSSPKILLHTYPERILEHAIKGMLPKGKLGRKMHGNLYIYAGSEHPHAAQQPKILKLNDIK